MAEYGADVACIGRDEAKLAETKRLVSQFGHRVITIKADVTREDEIKEFVDETVRKLGKIDIFFNNAGTTTMPQRIHEIPTEDWDRVINTNLRGMFLALKYVLPGMHKFELGRPRNIPVDAEMVKRSEKMIQEYCKTEVPMGRFADADELKGLAVLRASNASSYITGQVFVQDGGQSARL
jgi:NAD(P)-dependent dehydrogenase (short-subunit alcohol dehydrogenase family)